VTLTEAVDAAEMASLVADWGAAPREHHDLIVDHPFLSGPQQQLTNDPRRAEICYVMHRGDPADGLLLHIKTIYPDGAFRLPTGGIHRGDSVLDTLEREIFEETGLETGLGDTQVQVERLLGVVSYCFQHQDLGDIDFATYPFLVRMPEGAILEPQDPDEMIADWRWQPLSELNSVADYLENVATVDRGWRDWGRYRSIIHRFVAGAI
jgi:8-oxo-dGTP pyrophosphatase MutT (NUDIX family)